MIVQNTSAPGKPAVGLGWIAAIGIVVAGWLVSGCAHSIKPRYFASPEVAVTTIDRLLRSEQWRTLAGYYDFGRAPIPWSALESGEFFVRRASPEHPDPSGATRYRQPFPPGWNRVATEAGTAPDVVRVIMGIEIDQGGGPPQRGRREFRMRRSARGWQVLPNP